VSELKLAVGALHHAPQRLKRMLPLREARHTLASIPGGAAPARFAPR
jgi:hypothetical protein